MQKKLVKKIRVIKFLLIAVMFLTFASVEAATLSLSPGSGTYNVGDSFSVRLYVSSPSDSVNAVSSALVFSNDTLSLSSISKSGSVINFWAVEPSFVNSAGQAKLDGVAISGFTGNSGTVVTLNFRAIAEGSAYVRFSNASVLANDGAGTNVLTSSNGASFLVNKAKIQNSSVSDSLMKKPESKIATFQGTIKISEIRSIRNESGRSSFLIIPPKPAKDNKYDIQIDSEQNFSYIDDGYRIYQTDILPEGNHTIRVEAVDSVGNKMIGLTEFTTLPNESSSMDFSIKNGFGQQFEKSPNKFMANMIVVIGLLVIVLIAGFIKIKIAARVLNSKIKDAKKIVSKTFNLLEEDEDDENKLIRKLKKRKLLTNEDESNLDQFNKDISEAEKIITETLNDIKD